MKKIFATASDLLFDLTYAAYERRLLIAVLLSGVALAFWWAGVLPELAFGYTIVFFSLLTILPALTMVAYRDLRYLYRR